MVNMLAFYSLLKMQTCHRKRGKSKGGAYSYGKKEDIMWLLLQKI